MRISARLVAVVSMVLAACPPTPEPETLELTPTVLTLDAGETRTVTATLRTGTATAPAAGATWTSSDPAVLLVSSTGNGAATLQGLAAGTATVTARLREATASLAVTVNAVAITLTRIELTPATPSLAKGTSLQLTATGIFSDGTNAALTGVTWTSADENILTVNAAGLVSGVTAGVAEVTAAKEGKTATLSVTVTAATLMAIDVTPALPMVAKGTTQALVATGRFTDTTTQDLTQQVSWSSSNTAAVTVDATGLATALDVGDSLVNATFNGVTGGTTLTVTAATLTAIDLTPVSPTVPRGLTRQLNAIGRYSDGSTQGISSQVTWSSDTLTIATISSSGLVTAVAVGSARISASVDGVTGSTTVTVSAAQLVSLSVTPAMPSVARGLTRSFTAMGLFSDSTTQDLTTSVTWSSTAPAVASISNAAGSEGLATGQSVGTSTIRATSGTINAETTLTVTAATVVSLQVTPTTPSLPKGLTQQFTATAVLSDGTSADLTDTVSWTTGPVTVATISNAAGSKGLLTALATGNCNVTATLGTDTDSTTLTVTAARLDRIDVTPAIASVAKGSTLQLTATGVYSDASTQDLTTTATWSTTPATFGSISNAAGSEGLFTATAEGEATVTVTSGTITSTRAVTVTAAALTSLAVTPALPAVAKGRTQQFTAMGTFSDATTQNLTTQVTWTTGTAATASVSNAAGSEGLVSALAVGSTTVVATLGTVSGQTTLTVSQAELVSILVSGAPATLAKGRRVNLTATGTFSDASTQNLTTQVTWTSAPAATATVSNAAGSEGEVTAVAVGTAVVTAALDGKSDDASLDVTAAVLESLAITPANFSLAKGRTQQLSVLGTFSDATTQDLTATVTWGSTLATALSVSNATGSHGLASALTVGTGEVTAQSGTVTGRTNFTVTNAVLDSIAVTPAAPSIAKGRTQQFTATGTFSDGSTQNLTTTASWSSGTAATATVSNAPGSEGLATSAATGTTLISATSGTIVGSTTLVVTAEVLVSIAVTPASPTVQVGGTQQFIATGTYSDNSTQVLTTQVTWASDTTASLTISNAAGSEGFASGIAAGSSTVSATLGTLSGSTVVAVSGATLSSIAVTPAGASVAKGLTQQFTAIGTYSDATTQDLTTQVVWTAGSPLVLGISNASGEEGRGVALEVGITTVVATLGTVSGNTSFAVDPAELVSLQITGAPATLPLGRTAQLTATGTYTDSSTANLTAQVTWSATPAGNASFSTTAGSEGLVTSVSIGATEIKAALGTVSTLRNIDMVAAVLVSIAVTPASPTVNAGSTLPMVATGTYSDATTQVITAAWVSQTPATATIVGTTGVLTGLAAGTSVIVATVGSITGSTTVTVVYPPPVVVSTSPAEGATGVRASTAIAFTFNVAMDSNSFSTQNAAGPCTGTLQLSADNFTSCVAINPILVMGTGNLSVTVTPAAPLLPLGNYRLRVDAAVLSSNQIAMLSTFSQPTGFTVATDGPCGATLMISQLYANGGNGTGPTFDADFVELHNPGPTPVSLNGMALQYASATGSTWAVGTLPNMSVPPGGYFLVRMGTAGSVGAAFTADHILPASLGMGGSAGKVALTSRTTALSGTCPLSATLDFIGYGTTANCNEGGANAPVNTNTTAVFRGGAGCTDANVNGTDFTTGAPAPRGSATTPQVCICTANETDTNAELDFCNLQFPTTINVSTGATTPTIYARVFQAGITQAPGASSLRGEIGYGPTGVHPQTWPAFTWLPASYNLQIGNDDEYQVPLTAPAPGTYGYTSRFTRDGTNWTYCDINGAGANAGLFFEDTQLGTMTVNP